MLDQTLEKLVRYMAEKKASDLFITVGLPPCLKVNGAVMPITKNKLSQKECETLVLNTMDEDQQREFKKHKEFSNICIIIYKNCLPLDLVCGCCPYS